MFVPKEITDENITENVSNMMYLKDIEMSIKEVIAELLGSSDDAPNLDASFLELGINSVLAVELVEAMNQKLGIELGVEVMFDYRDVKELAVFIFQYYGAEDRSKELSPEEESDDNHKAHRDRTCSSPDIAIIGMSGRFADSPNIEVTTQRGGIEPQKDQ